LTAIVGFGANVVTGALLDMPSVSQAAKSRSVYIVVVFFITACWIWNAVVQVALSSRPNTTFDLGGGSFAGSAFAVYMCFRFFYEALQTYLYWLMGEVGTRTGQEGRRLGDVARMTGILRSWESIGSTIAYVVGATHWSNLNQMILGFVLWFVTVPFTLAALFGRWEPERGAIGQEEHSLESSSIEEQRVQAGTKNTY
jgi:hypothetical protein